MIKLLLIALIGYGAWSYYNTNIVITPVDIVDSEVNIDTLPYSSTKEIPLNFSCDGRQHCSQMSSYKEALFFIRNCPNTKMDGDNDDIPCERQF